MNRLSDTTTLDKATAYVILRLGRLLRNDLSRTLINAGVEITPEQWFILFRLYEQAGLSQSDLADKVLHDHPNITRMIDALEARVLIRRDNDPEDRRRYVLQLSDAGRQLVEQLFPLVIARRQQLFRGLDEQAIEHLHATLKVIEQNLSSE
jgi:MarR family transcriptional regulator, transcriptional regulator for hemolysin